MSVKRLIFIVAMILLLFAIVQGNLFYIVINGEYANKAKEQINQSLVITTGRGDIFDCNGKNLTNIQEQKLALTTVGDDSYTLLSPYISASDKNILYNKMSYSKPVLVPVTDNCNEKRVHYFNTSHRYSDEPIAMHTIGYINGQGDGVSGVEYLFNDILKNSGTYETVQCETNAVGGIMDNTEPYLEKKYGTGLGVELTLDSSLQLICEAVAKENLITGAIVLSEIETGRIKALVSMPEYNPYDVQSHILNNDTALLNRALCAYNVGSVYKPLLAAIAVEENIDTDEVYECKGYEEINGHIYKCAHGVAHGEVDLQTALEQSCNCYFINLGQKIGGEKIIDYSKLCGFGVKTDLGAGLLQSSGTLPDETEQNDLGQIASLSFGQGKLTATPIQINSFMNIFSNDGIYISPTLIEGEYNMYDEEIIKSFYSPQKVRVFSHNTSKIVHDMLISVVDNGLGIGAKPYKNGAGGKTGTAEIAKYNDEGKALYDAWFSGFFPAESPKYTLTILADSTTISGEEVSKIFEKIANDILLYES